MYLPSTGNQSGTHRSFRADGTISSTSTLILPQAYSRTMLRLQNKGTVTIFVEHGCARATVAISGGKLGSFSILNGGFGFTRPPIVELKGGVSSPVALASSGWDGRGQIDNWPVPSGIVAGTPPLYNRPGRAHAVLTAGVVTSIVVDDPGLGYVNPPEVWLSNDPQDPFGCADPFFGSATSGYALQAPSGVVTGEYLMNGTFCHTDAIALYAASSTPFYLEYAP